MKRILCIVVFQMIGVTGYAQLEFSKPIESFSIQDLWQKYLKRIPDCEFEYIVEASDQKVVHQFAKSGVRFYDKILREGGVADMVSYDGETFFSLYKSGTQLTVSSKKPEYEMFFSQKFKFNPLYLPLAIVSEGSFKFYKFEFYPPVISDQERIRVFSEEVKTNLSRNAQGKIEVLLETNLHKKKLWLSELDLNSSS